MSLTPAERVKLNAAIVNAARTGQPLGGELQGLYDRAVQLETTKQQQLTQQIAQLSAEKASQSASKNYANRGPAGLLNPGFPTRDLLYITKDPNAPISATRKGVDWGYVQGPTSDLPVTDFEELYPKRVPKLDFQDPFYASVSSPFGKEFDFTQEPIDIKNTETVNERAQRFLNQYFPGQKPGQIEVINPQTAQPYGNELILHDAMHDFANVNNTLRGEELITIAETVGATPLRTNRVGLKGLTQQVDYLDELNPAAAYENALNIAKQNTRMGGRTLVQLRGAAGGSSLFRDRNRVESFLSPPISPEEFNTMAQRGQEFYDQVHQNWNAFKRGGSVEWDDAPTREAWTKRNQALDEFMGNNPETYVPPRVVTQRIAGGYNKGGIPYGNPLSLMNAPLAPTVDRQAYFNELQNQINNVIPNIRTIIEKEQQTYSSPEQIALREAPLNWEGRADALRGIEAWGGSDAPNISSRVDVNSPEFQRDLRVYQALLESKNIGGRTVRDVLEDTIGPKPVAPRLSDVVPISTSVGRSSGVWNSSLEKNPNNYFKTVKENSAIGTAIDNALSSVRNEGGSGFNAAVPAFPGDQRIYLNPANLGVNNKTIFNNEILNAANINPKEVFINAAAKAKQIEGYNKALPAIKQAIRTGFGTATDVTGSVPLFDPAFRTAVEKGDVGAAARQAATEYAAGAAAAPVVGAGMGVLQRVAPRTAGIVAGGLGVVRAANPIAVVSQLGGSSKINPQADKTAIQSQLQRAQAARTRGGRWKFPTPFGTFTVPELGISESGGLFFP